MEGASELSGLIHALPGHTDPFRLWFRFEGLSPAQMELSGNPFVPALLAVAMWLNRPIEIDGCVSEQLLSGMGHLMNIWSQWERRLHRIEIRADAVREKFTPGRGAACFFTAGVDSFHTVLSNLATETGSARISHLFFASGQPDMALSNQVLFKRRCADIGGIARELGLTAIFASTNVRDIVPGMTLAWGVRAGSNLAAPALCLAPMLQRVIFSTGLAYDAWYRWGNDPLIDPLWNTEQMRFENHGYEKTRVRKVALSICGSGVALRNLRVCSNGDRVGGNCGRCEKCVRTMIALRANGALDRCPTLPHEIPLAAVRRFNAYDPLLRGFIAENRDALNRSGADPELAAVLADLLRPHPLRRFRYRVIQAAYRADRNFLDGRIRRWALNRARDAGTKIQLSENPLAWLLSQLRGARRPASLPDNRAGES